MGTSLLALAKSKSREVTRVCMVGGLPFKRAIGKVSVFI